VKLFNTQSTNSECVDTFQCKVATDLGGFKFTQQLLVLASYGSMTYSHPAIDVRTSGPIRPTPAPGGYELAGDAYAHT